MKNFLFDSFFLAAIAVGLFFVSYGYLASQKIVMEEPEARQQTQDWKTEDRHTDLPVRHEAARDGGAPIEPVRKPVGMVFPLTYYTVERCAQMDDQGVKVIAKGKRITVLDGELGYVAITDGKTRVVVKEEKISSDLAKIREATR